MKFLDNFRFLSVDRSGFCSRLTGRLQVRQVSHVSRACRRLSTSARSNFRKAACRPAGSAPRPCPHLRRLRSQDVGHRASLPNLLVQSFPIASGEGVGWYFGVIRTSTIQRCRPASPVTTRTPASTRLLRVFRCVPGRYCRAAAARRPSRWRWRHTSAQRQRSGFPRSVRSGGTRCAVHGAGSRRDVAAASGRRSRRREGLSVPIPSIRPGRGSPGAAVGARPTEPLHRPIFPCFSGSACASSRLGRSFPN